MAHPRVIRSDVTPASLRTWRMARRLSQADLADILGVDQPTISRWENATVGIPPFLCFTLHDLAVRLDPRAAAEVARRDAAVIPNDLAEPLARGWASRADKDFAQKLLDRASRMQRVGMPPLPGPAQLQAARDVLALPDAPEIDA